MFKQNNCIYFLAQNNTHFVYFLLYNAMSFFIKQVDNDISTVY
jgi:hypothetical protein